MDASTYDLGLSVGADLPTSRERRVFICPTAAVTVSLGPYDFLLEGENYRYIDFGIGIGAAAVAIRYRRFALLVAAGVRAAHLTATKWPSAAARAQGALGVTESGTYGLWSVGASAALDDRITVRAGLGVLTGISTVRGPNDFAVPFGREKDKPEMAISIGLSFGRRQPAHRTSCRRTTGRSATADGPRSAYSCPPLLPDVLPGT